MGFKCDECGALMFHITREYSKCALVYDESHKFSKKGVITNLFESFPEVNTIGWDKDEWGLKYTAHCSGCEKKWTSDDLNSLRCKMYQPYGVLIPPTTNNPL